MAARLEQPAPRGMYVSAEQPTRSIRQQPAVDGDLVVLSGDSHKPGAHEDERAHYDALREFASERFAVRSFDYEWSTQGYLPVDQLPYIGKLRRRSERIFVATGFQKWGMTNGTAAGILISDQIQGRENPWSELFDPSRITPAASVKECVKENLFVASRFVGDRIRLRGSIDLEGLQPGDGRVVSAGRKQIAVSCDSQGQLHALSARCTHMGCIVNWNTAERSWDCACHGSRFAADGNVIQAPATRPLEPDDLPTQAGEPSSAGDEGQ